MKYKANHAHISNDRRSASVVPGLAGNDAVLRLEIDKDTFADFNIRDLVRFSVATPWRLETANCDGISVSSGDGVIRIVLPQAFAGIEVVLHLEFNDKGALKLEASWKRVAVSSVDFDTVFAHSMAGLSFHLPYDSARLTLPHCIYNDNPSADPERTIPKVGNIPGLGYVCEEHRLPIPGVNLQWAVEDSDLSGGSVYPHLTIFAVPSQVKENKIDSVWSMGLLKAETGYEAVSLSGGLMFDGQRDVTYAAQMQGKPYDYSYNRMEAGEIWEKTYYLCWGDEHQNGWGYRSLSQDGWMLFEPQTEAAVDINTLIDLKHNCLTSRWYENDKCAGYACFGSANDFGNLSGRPEYFLYAWTGESIKLAWCDVALGLRRGNDKFLQRGLKAADFFVRESIRNDFGMPAAYYLWEQDIWGGAWFDNYREYSSRMVGCSLSDLIDIINLLEDNEQEVPAHWHNYVDQVAGFLSQSERLTTDGIFPLKWNSEGTPSADIITSAGVPCVIALSRAAKWLDRPELLDYAEKIMKRYYQLTAETMERPFAYATLDASCEDKEAGMYFFIACMELYKQTNKQKYLHWAGMSADWIMTYVYYWEPEMHEDSICRQAGFRITGWPGVSPQNHHLDVFFPLQELAEYSRITGMRMYADGARLVLDAWSHGVCIQPGDYGFSVPGEQGEQYYQTNYSQAPGAIGRPQDWRGGMSRWNPSWIIAEVLTACLYFEKLN